MPGIALSTATTPHLFLNGADVVVLVVSKDHTAGADGHLVILTVILNGAVRVGGAHPRGLRHQK